MPWGRNTQNDLTQQNKRLQTSSTNAARAIFTVIESQWHMGYKDVITKGYKLLAFNINSWKRLIVIFLGNWIRAPFFKLCWKAFNESWNWAVWHDIRKSTSVIIMQINSRGIPKPAARSRRNGCHPSSVSLSVKNLFTKKEAGVQTLKIYLLNLLNEPNIWLK